MNYSITIVFLIAAVSTAFGQSSVPGRLLVGFKPQVSESQSNALLGGMGARSTKKLAGLSVHIVDLPPTANPNAVANQFRGRPELDFIEPDIILAPVQATVVPNDPSYTSQWHLPKIQAPAAWAFTQGSVAIKIAILDTGVDPTHSDLISRITSGWNSYNSNSNSTDIHGHGTQVAGTASATGNNSLGGTGVSWNTLIMPVRVTDIAGYATYSTIASGLTWAADNGARVANISFDVVGSSTVSSAAQYFQRKGGVVISSAGNAGALSTLAASPYITTVSATDPNDMLYSWSTTGNRVTLSAPGCVFTTYSGNSYGTACGTSFSSPVVAGVAALLLSLNPNLTPIQVTSILESSADDLGPAGVDLQYGHGRVNAARALSVAFNQTSVPINPPTLDTQIPVIQILSPKDGATVSGNVPINVSASDNVAVTKVELLINGILTSTSTNSPFTLNWNVPKRSRGTFFLQSRAFDAAGNSGLSAIIRVYR